MNKKKDLEWSNCPKCGEKIAAHPPFEKEVGHGKKLLIVDDEAGIRDLLETAFEGTGFQISTAKNGKEAIHFFHQERPDVVLLDIKLPDFSGMEVLEQIQKYSQKATIIMITAVEESKTAIRCMKLGAKAYITKPFDLNYVTMLVKSAIQE